MKQEVTIDENEVNQAILDYAEKHGVKLENVSTKVTVVAGRGDRGVYATIAIEPNNIPKVKGTNSSVYIQALTEALTSESVSVEITKNIIEDEGVPEKATQEIDDEDEIFG